MKFAKYAAAAALAFVTVPMAAHAQVAVGAEVYGPEGGLVGQIESVSDQAVVVKTDKHSIPLPPSAFGESEKGPTITLNRDQLNAAMDEQLAAAQAQTEALLVEGTPVTDIEGANIGAIASVEGDNVAVEGDLGAFSLPKSAFVSQGNVLIAGVTAAQIEAQLGGGATETDQPGG
jgi:hypothetical protein